MIEITFPSLLEVSKFEKLFRYMSRLVKVQEIYNSVL